MPEINTIITPPTTRIQSALEPVHNNINSLMLLNKAEHLYGLEDWHVRAQERLTAKQLRDNQIALQGLFFAVVPRQSWPSFPVYLDYLAGQEAVALRDRVLEMYNNLPCQEGYAQEDEPEDVLASEDTFLDYLYGRFPPEFVDPAIERTAYSYLIDPPLLKSFLVNHLRQMWDLLLAEEWQRQLNTLQDCVAAIQQLDLAALSPLEAARLIIGDELPEWWSAVLEKEPVRQIVFVPSAHLGPYLGRFKNKQTLWILFGARLPQGSQSHSIDLSRSELLVRLNALADDTRLRILHLVRQQGEQCSPDIIEALNLSQSAASRHLKQLSATGYLNERRVDGAKCYTLNTSRIEDTLDALDHFLLQ